MARGSCAHECDVTRFTVDVLPDAEQEFQEAFLWYASRSAIAADAFRSHVIKAIDNLAERPAM
jgi:plasmid stabilization system protein ParE